MRVAAAELTASLAQREAETPGPALPASSAANLILSPLAAKAAKAFLVPVRFGAAEEGRKKEERVRERGRGRGREGRRDTRRTGAH